MYVDSTALARIGAIGWLVTSSCACNTNEAVSTAPQPADHVSQAADVVPQPPMPSAQPDGDMTTMTTCTTLADCMELSGTRVRVLGVYQRYEIGKGRGREFRGHVQIRLADCGGPLLGLHWDDEGIRSPGELERFEGRRVAVVGTFVSETPPKPGEPEHAAHLSISALTSIESIEIADSDDVTSCDPASSSFPDVPMID